MYKLSLTFNSPVCFIDPPLFDGIMAYCYVKDTLGYVPRGANVTEEELIPIILPLKKHDYGYYYASYLLFDKEKSANFTGSWKKRWDNKHDHLADFGKAKRQVEIDKGDFKSYDMPLNLWNIPDAWYYFDSDNIEEVKRLWSTYIAGIGKKTSQGYGEIKTATFEKINYNPFATKIIRPTPVNSLKISGMTDKDLEIFFKEYSLVRMPYLPPYSYIIDSRMEMCFSPY